MSNKDGYGRPQREAVVKFLEAVVVLSKEHGLSLSHEDRHGAFIVEQYSESNAKWLMAASDETEVK